MSALWAPVPDSRETAAPSRPGADLRAVGRPAPRLSRAPFLLVLIGVFGLGMAGLLMLNTTLQNQAFTARALDRQATELAYTQADLESRIDVLSAPPELARQASALGMRPNPYPVLLELPSGEVIGEPTPVSGDEVPSMVIKTPAEIAAEKAAAKAKAEAAKAEAAAEKKAAEKKAAEKKAAAEKAAEKKKKAAEKKPAQDEEGRG
ncbi:hypothetical protein GCM10009616_39770 [Microlunatus lacustris]